MPQRIRRKPRTASRQREANQSPALVTSKLTIVDSDGKERISLFVENETAMLALYDKRETPRFLVAVDRDGSAVMSALHSIEEKGIYEDSFRLVVSAGEPEIVMQDAIFKNGIKVSPDGFLTFEAPATKE